MRRNTLGIASDIGLGAFKCAQYGLFGDLFLTAAGCTLGGISITAMATAGAAGGAILVIPFILLSEQLEDYLLNRNSNFILRAVGETVMKGAFAAAAGLVGAAIMGLALTPVVLSTVSATLAFGFINLITHALVELGALFTQSSALEEANDKVAVLIYV